MIKKLRIKIIIVITFLVAVLIGVLIASVNIVNQTGSSYAIQNRLERLSRNDGRFFGRGDIDPYKDFEEAYVDSFSVLLDDTYTITGIILNRDITVQEDEIIPYVNQALQAQSDYGEIGNYAFYVSEKPYGLIVVFMDISTQQNANQNLVIMTSIIGILAILVFFVIAIILSGWLVKPVKETFDKQKLFISNASHELKTPLAVISANSDVLEGEIGENKWLSYIRSETVRMSELVNELLSLARLDDKSGSKLVMTDLNLTDLVLSTALPFESTMFENGKIFDVTAEPDVRCHGDESSIKHLLTILIDNAAKYSAEHGEISVRLYTQMNKNIIEVYNTGNGIPADKLHKIFERFYREDEARNSQSGGYGLGLAIAKSIAQAHNGKIRAESEYGKWVRFIVVLP